MQPKFFNLNLKHKLAEAVSHFIIINPNSGRRKGKRDWPHIATLLQDAGIVYEYTFTHARLDAVTLAKQAVERGIRNIIVIAGDGTLNEAANGILLQQAVPSNEVSLGMIPVGTGNDWGRMYQCPTTFEDCVNMIRDGHSILQDAGVVIFSDAGIIEKRYFINVAGIGCDAVVVKDTNRRKDEGGGGKIAYMLSLLRSIFKFSSLNASITADGQQLFSGELYSANFGICRYSGGGMMQVPHAIPDDGLLDITIIRRVGKMKIIRNTPKLYDGTFTIMKEVSVHRAASVTIHSNNDLLLEADGESLGTAPIEVSVLTKALRIIVPLKSEK
ncbi:MAG: diacylglycerol kinase family protein [Bacteroidota bacterium]